MPLNREQQVQEALNSDEAQRLIKLIAAMIDVLEDYFEKRKLLVNVDFATQPPPGYLGTIKVRQGRFSVLLH